MPASQNATRAVRAGVDQDRGFGAIMPPLYLSTNFSFAAFGQPRDHDYTRAGNPTRDLLADALTDLEEGEGAVVTASGMAALDLALNELRPGDRLIAPHDCYGGSQRLLSERAVRGAYEVVFVDQGDEASVARELERGARAILIETPSNPLLRVVDISALAELAHRTETIVVVDNTFLSPALQQPLKLGADRVVHSTTKYINGHSDVVGGAVVCASAVDAAALALWANTTGVTGAPFDSYLTLRGLRTLFVRIARQQASAAIIAERLEAHPAVARVHYPGLPSHPGHDLARRQQAGFGAMLSFALEGGAPAVEPFVQGLRLFSLAESLGGVESLVSHPATMTHASMSAAARQAAGIGDDLLRLSIGVEDSQDLWSDLDQALSSLRAPHGANLKAKP